MKIQLVLIGQYKVNINMSKLTKWKSKYFSICDIKKVMHLDINHFRDDYCLPCTVLNDVIVHENKYDASIGIVDQPLEGNYYMHRLNENKAVISLYEIKDILRSENISIEHYIIRCIYEMTVFFYEFSGKLNDHIYLVPHDETRGCLFDMNVFKTDIIHSLTRPTICTECEARLNVKALPSNFISNIKKELRKIDKKLYSKLTSFIKAHPMMSIIITSSFAIFLNIIANVIYDLF